MKILNVKLFLTLFACLYLQQSLKAQTWAIEGDNGKNIEFEYQTGLGDAGLQVDTSAPDDHAHLAINTVNAGDNSIIGKSIVIDETGKVVIGVGTEDDCMHFAEEDYDINTTYLVVRGDAFKTGTA